MYFLVLFALVAGASASSYPVYQGANYYYGGKFAGKCGHDGLYFNDRDSFVICTNSIGYVQPCAPGSRNGPVSGFSQGKWYNFNPFCGVNLVNQGYTARHSSYGRATKRQSYGHKAASGYQKSGGYGRPSYQKTTYTRTYTAPTYQVPTYHAPRYPAPRYPAPRYQAPTYKAPTYKAPTYKAPTYKAPTYKPVVRSYSTKTYQTHTYKPRH